MVSSSGCSDQPRSVSGRSPHVVIVIVNWNGLPDTLECLHSIAKIDYDNYRIVLVDNGSEDGSVLAIRAAFPDVHLIETNSNLGFAEGNNRGIKEALDSDFILLLNNDTTVDANLLDSLVTEALSDPLTAALGPVICYADDPDGIWCAGLKIGNGSAYGIRLQCTTSILMYNGARVDELPSEDFDVDAVVGCAMLLRTSVVKEIGMLDASLFMIHEDFDWSLRARAAGYRCRMKSLPGVWHKVSSSINVQDNQSERNPFSLYYWYRNWLVVVRKHFGYPRMLSVAAMYLFHLFPRLILDDVRSSECSLSMLSAYFYALKDPLFGTLKIRFLR